MIGALVFEIRPDKDQARQQNEFMTFHELPRVGDIIAKNDDDEEGKGRIYEVLEVHIPNEPPMTKENGVPSAGDIFIVHRGLLTDYYKTQKEKAAEKFVPYDKESQWSAAGLNS